MEIVTNDEPNIRHRLKKTKNKKHAFHERKAAIVCEIDGLDDVILVSIVNVKFVVAMVMSNEQ